MVVVAEVAVRAVLFGVLIRQFKAENVGVGKGPDCASDRRADGTYKKIGKSADAMLRPETSKRRIRKGVAGSLSVLITSPIKRIIETSARE